MQKTDPNNPQNFQDIPEHVEYLENLIENVNTVQLASINAPLYGGPTNDPYVEDSKIRVELNEIYFWQDDYGWNSGGSNFGDDYNFNNYNVNPECELNVFLCEIDGLSGWGPSEGIILDWLYSSYLNGVPLASSFYLFTHELGHVLGLGHSWRFSQFEDFPDIYHPQCGTTSSTCLDTWCDPNTDALCVNNFMSYSKVNNFLSPLQLGRIHKNMIHGFQSGLLNVEYDASKTITINQDEVWDVGKYIAGDVIITPENRLTIRCKVLMPPGGKIIVQPGAELYVEGGWITTASRCNDYWQGIVVHGNPSANQWIDPGTGYRKQGYVLLKNGAIIENAVEAVSLYDVDSNSPLTTTGGIVNANRAMFKNNIRAVHFMPYSGHPGGNASIFMACDFFMDSDYTGGSDFEEMVKLHGVNGILFRGCDFNYDEDFLYLYQGAGIRAVDAGFSVLRRCLNGGCTQWEPSSFRNLDRGVDVSMTGCYAYTYVVDRADFIDNKYGIYNAGVNNAQITRNSFFIGGWDPDNPTFPDVGIYINTGTGYSIESNTFIGDNTTRTVGTLIRETGDDLNQVYKNDYDGLSVANLSNRDNVHEDEFAQGLKYFCNTNSSNDFDFAIPSEFFVSGEGISIAQGVLTQSTGNTFSFLLPLGDESDFFNHGEFDLDYFYYDQEFDQIPQDVSSMIDPISTQFENQCLSNYNENSGVDGPIVTHFTDQFNGHKPGFDSLEILRNTLIDGGNTDSLVNMIASTFTTNGPQLKSYLLNISPYLSKAALEVTSDRTDILSHTDIYDIMIANPDESRHNALLNYLENNADPMPTNMITALKNQPYPATARTILENNRTFYYEQVSEAVDFILKYYMTDTIGFQVDSIDYWLEQKGTLASELQRVDLWLSAENITEAGSILNAVIQNYTLSAKQLEEYHYFDDLKTIQIDLINQGKCILDLDSTQILHVVDIADQSEWIAGQQARNILNFAYGYDYQPDIIMPISSGGSRLAESEEIKMKGQLIYAFPNPASNLVTFHFKLGEVKSETAIEVFNTFGTLIFTKEFKVKEGFVDWNTMNVTNGVYFYTIRNSDGFLESGQLIIAH